MFEDVKIKKREESARLRRRNHLNQASPDTYNGHSGPTSPYLPVTGNGEPGSHHTITLWVQNGAAILVILSFVSLLFCVLYREGNLPNKDIFNILLGILGTVVVQIFQYWFGASAGTPAARHGTYAFGEREHP